MVNQQLQTIQDKLQQKNELPRGSKEREDLVNEIKSQVSISPMQETETILGGNMEIKPESQGECQREREPESHRKSERVTESQRESHRATESKREFLSDSLSGSCLSGAKIIQPYRITTS